MKATVQFLNVGWGDAHLIKLPSGSVSLIDGGDGGIGPDQDHPLDWMDRNGIRQLDWMILTHIHEDHLNGLLDIAKDKKVIRAILPYEPFELPFESLDKEHNNPTEWIESRMLYAYLELIRILAEQGTEIIWRSTYSTEENSIVWSEDGYSLQQLYPWNGDPLPAYEVLMKAIADRQSGALEETTMGGCFFNSSNHDSSVYRLTVEGKPGENILFGGDLLEPGWEILASRVDLQSRVWKVSHHGVEDGFNARILAWIRPEYCIIPICLERAPSFQKHWEELSSRTNASFHMTGSAIVGTTRTLYSGAIEVQFGY